MVFVILAFMTGASPALPARVLSTSHRRTLIAGHHIAGHHIVHHRHIQHQ
jgi:hypothetical protein